MTQLQWTDAFETGIDYLDYEHRQLLELVNAVCADPRRAAGEAGVAEALGELHAKVCGHFALEEKLMRERKYALYELHKSQHERLLDEIRDMIEAYDNGACENCGKRLEDCLTAWFHKHFRFNDEQDPSSGSQGA